MKLQAFSFFSVSLLRTKGYIILTVIPRGEIHLWVEFAPVSGQTYLSVYMFNRDEISPLPLFLPCLEDKGETHPGVTRHNFNV